MCQVENSKSRRHMHNDLFNKKTKNSKFTTTNQYGAIK